MTKEQLQEKKKKLNTTIDIHHHCQLSDRETEGDLSVLHPPSRETSLALISIIFDLLDEKKKSL